MASNSISFASKEIHKQESDLDEKSPLDDLVTNFEAETNSVGTVGPDNARKRWQPWRRATLEYVNLSHTILEASAV
jgi:hypothetical protein